MEALPASEVSPEKIKTHATGTEPLKEETIPEKELKVPKILIRRCDLSVESSEGGTPGK